MKNARMKRRNIGIIVLFLTGLLSWGLVEGIALPLQEQREAQYDAAQKNPLTHDIGRSAKFETKYMGDASKVTGLFGSLPIGPIHSFALDPETFTVQVNVDPSVKDAESGRYLSYLYSATAAFAYIDNLEAVIFNEGQTTFRVTRKDLTVWYGVDNLAALTDPSAWKDSVQSRLADQEYVQQSFRELFRETKALSV